MLQINDVKELQSRMKMHEGAIDKCSMYYVREDEDRRKVYTRIYADWFECLPPKVYEKVLNLCKKLLSKNVGNNILSGEFGEDNIKLMLGTVVNSESDTVGEKFLVDRITSLYKYVGNYLIILAHCTYDVPKVGKDGKSQGESEWVYKHLMCAICPVTLEAAGIEVTKGLELVPKERRWMIQEPLDGFIYPAFEEREICPNKIMYYTAKKAEPHHGFMEHVLGMKTLYTQAEMMDMFDQLMLLAAGESKDVKNEYMLRLGLKLSDRPEGDVYLDMDELAQILQEIGMDEGSAVEMATKYGNIFAPEYPSMGHLVNIRYIEMAREKLREERKSSLLRKAAAVLSERGGNEELINQLRQEAGRK